MTNRVWHLDNLAIVGDAAHTTHFSIGCGTKLALQDAIALADELHSRQTLGEALAGYQSNRRRATELAQRDARHSLNWFQDVPRYIDRPVSQFVELMHARRSSLQAHLPPAAYLGIVIWPTPDLRCGEVGIDSYTADWPPPTSSAAASRSLRCASVVRRRP